MGIIDKLLGRQSKDELVEMHVCPNCWGKQEYADEYKAYVADQTKANINHDKANQKAFIQQFVETRISGIKLVKDGDKLVCKKCNQRY